MAVRRTSFKVTAVSDRPQSKRPWTEHPRVLAIRHRSTTADIGVQTIGGYGRHRSSQNAALIAHFGFLSIFPLVLALTTILGFVLDGRADLRADIIDSALAQVPIVGQTLEQNPAELNGSALVLLFGLLAALWSGLRAFLAIQIALDDVREIPRDERSSFAAMRLRALLGVAVIGGGQIATAAVTAIAGAGDFALAGRVLLVLGALAINAATLGLTFQRLTSVDVPWREVAPGALIGGVAFSIMQFLGTTVAPQLIANASPVYGTFASVIALFTWLGLHAMVALLCAELNGVLVSRRNQSHDRTPTAATTEASVTAPA